MATLPSKPGIYLIACRSSDKCYVGSAINIYRRWLSHHLPDLRRGRHCNRYLQNAWKKHGEACFSVRVLELCDKPDLVQREQHWIDILRTADNRHGYNLCPLAGSSLGARLSDDQRVASLGKNAKRYIVRTPTGEEFEVVNLYEFCQSRGLISQAMCAVARGRRSSNHRGWECRRPGQTREEWLATLRVVPKAVVIRGRKKLCPKCEEWLPLRSFSRDKSLPSGLACYCRKCKRARLTVA